MATKTLAERIERARLQLDALNKAKRKVDSKESAAKRKAETRLKIIAGAWFLNQATPEDKQKMIAGLAEKDRAVFK
jgi:hypothetical protein